MKTIASLTALFLTYRPLLYALVALGKGVVRATSRASDGGRYVSIEERMGLNRVFWTAYDKAVMKPKRWKVTKIGE